MRRSVLATILGILLLLLPGTGEAHPHLFLETSVGVAIMNGRLEGIRVRWVWDPWCSEDILLECDADGDGRLNAAEAEGVRRTFFEDAWDARYFTAVFVEGKKVAFERARDFKVGIMQPDGRIVFDFLLPLSKPPRAKGKVEIVFNDDTIFTAFEEFVGAIGDSSAMKGFASKIYDDFGVKISFVL